MPQSAPHELRRPRRKAPRAHGDGARAATAVDWRRLRRFLVLGSDGGAYRAGERTPPQAHAALVERCLRADGPRLVAEIVAVRAGGRDAREAPALFALALAATTGDLETRRAAHEALPAVALTSEQLFAFVSFAGEADGWGRSLRRAVGRWYASWSPDALGREAIAWWRTREGLTHRDVLRIAYPAGRAPAESGEHGRLLQWLARGGPAPARPPVLEGFAQAQATDGAPRAAALVREYRLPPQALRAEHLASAEVWSALLEDMPLRAVLRNLAAMTDVGLLAPGSDAAARVAERLRDGARLRAARIEPLAVLAALRAYAYGQGAGRAARCRAVPQVVGALEEAFHSSLANVEPTARRILIALDVSPSMRVGTIAGMPGLSPLEAATALALVSASSEPHCVIAGFAGNAGARRRGLLRAPVRRMPPDERLTPLPITAGQRLAAALAAVSDIRHGDTDFGLPMRQALERGLAFDAFVILTDADTLARETQPAPALAEYRRWSGIDARLVVVAMATRRLSVADPADPGMLDVVGFDLATPRLIADFVRGEI